jgi:hypothetical protein
MRRENFLELDAVVHATGAVRGWNRLALQAIRSAQPGPLASARSLAILHTCMYNAWAAYDDRARQTAHGVAVRLPQAERSAASRTSAMSHAARCALGGRFPAQQAVFDAWMRAGLGLDPAAPGGPLSPAGIGRTQAASMLDFWQRDAGRTAAPSSALQVADPAPGRWCLAAHRLSERDHHDDDQDVRLFFALANALADAAIAGWGGAQGGHGGHHGIGSVGAAAGEVVRRFAGEMRGDALIKAGSAGQALGRQVGAHAFEDARRHWEGKL